MTLSYFLNQVCTWFIKIAFIGEVGVSMCSSLGALMIHIKKVNSIIAPDIIMSGTHAIPNSRIATVTCTTINVG